jgi:hypothetical protein
MAYITIIIITAKATLDSSTTVHDAYYSLLKTDFFTQIAANCFVSPPFDSSGSSKTTQNRGM